MDTEGILTKYTLWKHMLTATQPAGAPASMGINLSGNGERIWMISAELIPIVGAGRNVSLLQFNDNDTVEYDIIPAISATTGQRVPAAPRHLAGATAAIVAQAGHPYPWLLGGGDYLEATGASLLEDETLAVVLSYLSPVQELVVAAIGTAVTIVQTLRRS